MERNDVQSLLTLAESLAVPLAAIEDTSVLAEPVAVGDFLLPNALVIHPMEGCDGDAEGRPSKLTIRRYDRFAAGGAGLIWAEAIAVVPEGRANPRQLWLHESVKEDFTALVARTREVGAGEFGADFRPMIVAQLTHSGRYSRPTDKPGPIIPRHDSNRDARMNLAPDWPVVDDAYLDALPEAYLRAARLAFDAGFDAVDIKSCHGYLINELFACRDREGKYGGSFENRTRLLLAVVDRIRDELGPDKHVTVRLGCFDAIPNGWAVDLKDHTRPDLTEPKKLIAALAERGVKMINATIANPYYNPHYGRPFNAPVDGASESPDHPLISVSRLIELVGEIQRAFPDMAIVGTGYSWLGTWMPYVAAATRKNGLAKLIGSGRMAFAYPNFPRDIIARGALDPEKVCIACSGCTQIMRDRGRTGCVVRDHEVYGPIFEHGRIGNRTYLTRLAERCQQCPNPACQAGCPAGIDIPRFVNLFLESKDREAYEIIRRDNILPEICAWLCPVETQCQGHCLMSYVGEAPVPIAGIQRYLAEQANRQGWSKLRIPEHTTGKSIAVMGAGPAGLACAAALLEAGHKVTVFDKNEAPGGMIESVIPSDRQSTALANELRAVFGGAPADRLRFDTGKPLTASFNLEAVAALEFDAIFIGIGLPRAAAGSDKPDLLGVTNALDFLRESKTNPDLDLTGKRVAVIGGGNTAMDAAVTARRLGAEDVHIIYRRSFEQMPAWPEERNRALDGGVHFLILTQQVDYLAKDRELTGIMVCPTRLGEPEASGRRRPEPQPDKAYELEMELVIESIGQEAPADLERMLPGVDLAGGLIATLPGSARTSRPEVFAGGDLVRGASTVVAAVVDGMKAAKEIDAFLRQPSKEGR